MSDIISSLFKIDFRDRAHDPGYTCNIRCVECGFSYMYGSSCEDSFPAPTIYDFDKINHSDKCNTKNFYKSMGVKSRGNLSKRINRCFVVSLVKGN